MFVSHTGLQQTLEKLDVLETYGLMLLVIYNDVIKYPETGSIFIDVIQLK